MSQFESSTFESLQSAFAAGLDTNSIPSECQLEHPQSLIAQSRNGMTSISHPIAQTTSEEAKGTAYLLGHEASLPPVVRMPDDVIREIFLACMPEDRNCAMRASEAPLLLGRVCSAWRSIAYSTPRLWSKLHVDAPRTPGPLGTRGRWEVYRRKWAVRADVIRTWLGRSGEVPLSLSFKTFDDADGSPHGSAHIEPLMSLARRWADVDFKVNRDELARLAEIQVGDVPKLERVKVTTVDSLWVNDLSAAALLQAQTAVPMPPVEAGTHQLWAKLQILGAPRVSHVAIDTDMLRVQDLPFASSKLHSLTVITAGGDSEVASVSADDLLAVLLAQPQLQTARFTVDDSAIQGHLPSVVLANLHTLELHVRRRRSTSRQPMAFLSSIEAPNLRCLEIRHWGRQPRSLRRLPDAFLGLLGRLPQLESIHITSDCMRAASVEQALAALPTSVKHLSLEDTGAGVLMNLHNPFAHPVSRRALSAPTTVPGAALSALATSPTILPELESISLRAKTVVQLTPLLIKFLVARRHLGPENNLNEQQARTTLGSVKTSFARPVDLDAVVSHPLIQSYLASAEGSQLKLDIAQDQEQRDVQIQVLLAAQAQQWDIGGGMGDGGSDAYFPWNPTGSPQLAMNALGLPLLSESQTQTPVDPAPHLPQSPTRSNASGLQTDAQ